MDTRRELPLISASSRLTLVLRWTYYALLALIIIPFGSLDPRTLHLFSLCVFLLSVVIVVTRPVPSRIRGVFAATVIVSCLLAVWVILQATDIPNNLLANPIWGQAEVLFGPMPRAISVAPADSLEAMIAVLLPFVVFAAGMLLFTSDESAQRLLRYLCILGAAIAAFGLVEFAFFPGQQLFAETTEPLTGLTAVFLNQNTTATFLGLVVLLGAALAFGHIQRGGFRAFLAALSGKPARIRAADLRWTIFYSVVCVLAAVALMLTKSRAGVAASLLGLAVLLAILAYGTSHSRSSRHGFAGHSLWWRLARTLAALMTVVVIGTVFAGQALLRANVQGASDLRFCVLPGELRLLGDNWLVGTGLATFRDVFSPYLDPSCGMNFVWNRAHNFYIEGWVNLGLPFVVLTTAVLVVLLVVLVGGMRTRRRLRFIPALGLGMVVIVVVHSAVDYSLQIPGFAVFWAAGLAPCVVIATGRTAPSR